MTTEWDGFFEAPSGEQPSGITAVDPVLPHDLEAEGTVLSAILREPEMLEHIRSLKPEDFFSGRHRLMWQACLDLDRQALGIDRTSVAGWLEKAGKLQQCGGLVYLAEVIVGAPAVIPRHLKQHAGTIRGHALTRAKIVELDREVTAYRCGELSVPAESDSSAAGPAALGGVVFAETLGGPVPAVPWLCEGLRLASGSPTVIAGNSYSGKSILAADLALAVASGQDVFGIYRCKQGTAVYLDYDGQGLRISQDRFQRMAKARGFELEALGAALAYSRRPGFYLDDDGADEKLLHAFDGVSVCVIDSWRGATPNTDEWKRGPVQKVADRLTLASEKTGCCFIIIDHNIKPARDGQSSRSSMHETHGSSAKSEVAQGYFTVEGEEGQTVANVKHPKERVLGKRLAPFSLRYEDVPNGNNPRWGLRVTHLDAAQRSVPNPLLRIRKDLLEAIKTQPGITVPGLLQTVSGRKLTIVDILDQLVIEKVLAAIPVPGRKGFSYRCL